MPTLLEARRTEDEEKRPKRLIDVRKAAIPSWAKAMTGEPAKKATPTFEPDWGAEIEKVTKPATKRKPVKSRVPEWGRRIEAQALPQRAQERLKPEEYGPGSKRYAEYIKSGEHERWAGEEEAVADWQAAMYAGPKLAAMPAELLSQATGEVAVGLKRLLNPFESPVPSEHADTAFERNVRSAGGLLPYVVPYVGPATMASQAPGLLMPDPYTGEIGAEAMFQEVISRFKPLGEAVAHGDWRAFRDHLVYLYNKGEIPNAAFDLLIGWHGGKTAVGRGRAMLGERPAPVAEGPVRPPGPGPLAEAPRVGEALAQAKAQARKAPVEPVPVAEEVAPVVPKAAKPGKVGKKPAKAKEAWEMRPSEYLEYERIKYPATVELEKLSPQKHRLLVEKAVMEGRSVPPEVLADYPDLAAKYGKVAASKAEAGQLPKRPSISSVKNAVTAKRRAELGLEPVERRPRTPVEKREQVAKDLIDSGAILPEELARDVIKNERPLDLMETAVLDERLSRVAAELEAARRTKDTPAIKKLTGEYDLISEATQRGGTELGRAMEARKAERDPYALEELLHKGRTSSETFDTAAEGRVITLHQKLKAGEAAEAAVEARLRAAAARPRTTVKVKRPTDFAKPSWGESNTIFTTATRDAARQRLAEKAARVHMGADPTMVADLAIEIGYHAEAGVRFSYRVMHDYLQKTYKASSEEIKAAYTRTMNDKRLAKSIEYQKKQAAELKKGIETKTGLAKPPPVEYNNEWVRLHQENVKLRAQLDNAVSPRKSLGARFRDVLRLPNIPTGWLAAWDDSFIGRQGWRMLWYSPISWGRGLKASLKAMGSERAAYTIDTVIREHPHFAKAQQSKVAYTEIEKTARPASLEEISMYMQATSKIPVLGRAVRPFERAFTTAANVMRHDPFYRMVEAHGWEAHPLVEWQWYGKFLNKLTGRGELGRLADLQPELGAFFISPRKVAADLQILLTPFTGPKWVRKEAAKGLVRQVVALHTFGIAVNASGKGTVGLDPRDPDYMNLRIGNTRFDLTGGERTVVKAIWRVGRAAYKGSRFGPGLKYGEAGAWEEAERYFGYKMSPGLQAGESAWTGLDWLGRPISDKDIIKTLLTPWNVRDITEAWNEDGAGMGVTAGFAAFWGLNSQSYEDRNKSKKTGAPPPPGKPSKH